MSGHNFLRHQADANYNVTSSVNASALPSTESKIINIITAGAETRTLAAPVAAGIVLGLNFLTDGGDCVITVATAFDDAGSTTITLSSAGQYVELVSRKYGSVYRWRETTRSQIAATDAELSLLTGLLATGAEINRVAQASTRIVSITTSTIALTLAAHDGKTVVFNRAAGIAATLPAATGSGARFRIVVGTAFTGDATIKVNTTPGTDTMVGLVLGLDGDGVPANAWTVGGTNDTITMDGSATPNMTQGGFVGDMYDIQDIATGVWQVNGFIKQTGTEATPMSASVP
jgi:hypothetical protein